MIVSAEPLLKVRVAASVPDPTLTEYVGGDLRFTVPVNTVVDVGEVDGEGVGDGEGDKDGVGDDDGDGEGEVGVGVAVGVVAGSTDSR